MATISPTRPKPYPQGDGSWAQWLNCVLACATDLMCRASVGYWRVAASKLRTLSGDKSGGVTYGQAADATIKATNGQVVLEPRYGLNAGQVQSYIASGRAAAISIDCSVTRYTSRRTNTFTGGHSVYIQQYRWTAPGQCGCELQKETQHGEYLIEDPGTTSAGYRWWSSSLVYRAALARGGGSISIMLCRDTEGVTRTTRKDAVIRASASTTSQRVAKIPKGRSLYVTSTRDGGPYISDTDGQTSHNWHRVRYATGKYGFTKGENLR